MCPVQPVYKKEALSRDQPLRRSRSAPNLTEWPVLCKAPAAVPVACRTSDDEDEEAVRQRFEKHRMKRRRALSQNKMRSLLRRTKATSEIDLAHIDKEATFGADIASYEILSRVVDALETAVPNQPGDHQHLHQHQHQQPQPAHHHLHPDSAYSVSASSDEGEGERHGFQGDCCFGVGLGGNSESETIFLQKIR